mmetsp:Transcript_6295/g.26063  ORF Transcript_6295/g.26063 Transcript_6295/m.26063 type:complete len:213 (-) Transcript_6295:875-1513(-)
MISVFSFETRDQIRRAVAFNACQLVTPWLGGNRESSPKCATTKRDSTDHRDDADIPNSHVDKAQDKNAKGIPRNHPCTKAKRTRVVSGRDDRGDWQRTKKESRQAEFAKLGCMYLREKDKDALVSPDQYMADGQKSLNKALNDRGLGQQTLKDYGDAVSGLEDWILHACPDSPDRLRLVEMDELLTKALEAEAKGDSFPDMTNKFSSKPMSK